LRRTRRTDEEKNSGRKNEKDHSEKEKEHDPRKTNRAPSIQKSERGKSQKKKRRNTQGRDLEGGELPVLPLGKKSDSGRNKENEGTHSKGRKGEVFKERRTIGRGSQRKSKNVLKVPERKKVA